MILLALGANLPSVDYGEPRATLEEALRILERSGLRLVERSPWYISAPVPPSGQPDYVNGVVRVESALSPAALLALLHEVEARLGRVRGERNAARPADLDLLDYDGQVSRPGESPVLPHPRLHQRAFVLLPLADVAPGWRHPVTGEVLAEMMVRLDPAQVCRPEPAEDAKGARACLAGRDPI